MSPEESQAAELQSRRDAYDDAIETLANKYARLEPNGHHCYTEPSPGFWPHLLIEGRAGDSQVVTFRGFHHEFYLTVPRERFEAFFAEALAHLEGYPEDAYGEATP